MRYTTEYKGMTPTEKRDQAINDIKEYLGLKKFHQMNEQFKAAGKIDAGQFEFICMVGGIEGYPVEAWYLTLYGAKQ